MNARMNKASNMGAALNDFHVERSQSFGLAPGDGLTVTVIFTDERGTQAALRMASNLSQGLNARIRLLVAQGVPFHFPLDRPPVSIDFLERRPLCVVSDSGVEAGGVCIEIFLCRNRKECLRRVLSPRSLIVLGGARRRRLNEARRLEAWLNRLGHRVIFAELESRDGWVGIRSLWFRALAWCERASVLPHRWSWRRRDRAPASSRVDRNGRIPELARVLPAKILLLRRSS
jgi:hypothetical protein